MTYYYSNELYHHGVLGQKWGIRRYQNEDGSCTKLGKERRSSENENDSNDNDKQYIKTNKKHKVLKSVAAIGLTALAAYGAYKVTNGVIANKSAEKHYAKGKKYVEMTKKMAISYDALMQESKKYSSKGGKRNTKKSLYYLDKAYKTERKLKAYKKKASRNIKMTNAILNARTRV